MYRAHIVVLNAWGWGKWQILMKWNIMCYFNRWFKIAINKIIPCKWTPIAENQSPFSVYDRNGLFMIYFWYVEWFMLDMMIWSMLIDLNMLSLPVYWFHSIMVTVYSYIHYVVLMNGWMCSDMPYGYPKYYMGLMIGWRSYEGDRCPKSWFSRKIYYFTKWDFVFLLKLIFYLIKGNLTILLYYIYIM